MFEWFNSYPGFFQGVLIVAIIATVIMIIQIIMILVGAGLESSFDGTDLPGDLASGDDPFNDSGFIDIFGLKILTVRNIIAFFSIGGWASVAMYEATNSYAWSIVLGLVAGILAMFLFSLGIKTMLKLQQDGTKDIRNAVGKTASVYLTIPANKSGLGKINVIIQETLVEYTAMTEDVKPIATGEQVVVCEVCNDYLIVKRIIKGEN